MERVLMRTPDRASAPNWVRRLHVFFLAVLLVVTTFQAPLTSPVADTIHEGEYLMYGLSGGRVIAGQPAVYPHGGIDHIPVRLAAVFRSPDRQIVCVRVINAAATAVAVGLFLALLAAITGLGTFVAFAAGLPAIVTLMAYNGAATAAVDLQQGAPGIRDLFVLINMFLIVRLIQFGKRLTERACLLRVAVFSFVSGFGLFWSYDRGLVAVALAVGAAIGFARMWWDVRAIPAMLIGGGLGFGLAGLSGLYGTIAGNSFAISYWFVNGSLSRLPFSEDLMMSLIPAIALFIILIAAGWFATWRSRRIGEIEQGFLFLLLMAATGFYAILACRRPDATHIGWVLAMASLLAAALLRHARAPWMLRARRSVVAAIAVVICFVFVNYATKPLASLPKTWMIGIQNNVTALRNELPRDAELVPPGLREAADTIRARPSVCTYSLSSDGLLYLLARTPPCSRFAYPSYVSLDRQVDVIGELERGNPPFMEVHSSNRSNDVDGKGLAIRAPALSTWIAAHYRNRRTLQGGYELLTR
jgi:hypothetical protein